MSGGMDAHVHAQAVAGEGRPHDHRFTAEIATALRRRSPSALVIVQGSLEFGIGWDDERARSPALSRSMSAR